MSGTDEEQKAETAFSIDPYVIKDPEKFALNVARAVEQLGKAASAWVTPREKGEVSDSLAGPYAEMVKTFSKV